MKYVDSFLYYLSEGIIAALFQAAEEAVEATQESVTLWNVVIESPVIHLARDKELLRQSPDWIPPRRDTELRSPIARRRSSGRKHSSKASSRLIALSIDAVSIMDEDDDEFFDASDHPTPMVDDFDEFLVAYPGRIHIRNMYELTGGDAFAIPPFLVSLAFTKCHVQGVDRVGMGSGALLGEVDWELSVRMDGQRDDPTSINYVSMHMSAGFKVAPLRVELSQELLCLVMNCVDENVFYYQYFPEEAPKAPAGATATYDGKVEAWTMNTRFEFDDLTLALFYPSKVGEVTWFQCHSWEAFFS